MPKILVCHLQIDEDPDTYPDYHFEAEPDPDPACHFDEDRILSLNLMRIRIRSTGCKYHKWQKS